MENIGESDLNNEPVGSGPFKFEEYKSGEYYKVTKFDDYFDDVNLDSITFKIVKDSSSANAALASGDLDARLISADDYDTVSAYDNVNINTYNSGRVNAMFMNELNEDLQDVKVRQAIAYALNKEEFCQFAFLSEDYAELQILFLHRIHSTIQNRTIPTTMIRLKHRSSFPKQERQVFL